MNTPNTDPQQITELILEFSSSRISFAEEEEEEEEARLVVSLIDLTERRRADQRIRELAALLEKTQDAIYVRDLEQRITYWNHGAERLYGWTAQEVMGKRAVDFLYDGDSPELQEIRRIVMDKGEWTGEVRQLTRSRKQLVVQSRRTLLRDQHGRPCSMLSINTDITAKKQLETQFLRAQRMENIGALAGGVAHDLNNILAPILMGMQLFRLQFNDEASAKLIDRVETSARRGADLVKQILSFARGSENKRTLIQLKHLISEQFTICKETFPPGITVQRKVAQGLWPVLGDVTQLYQVLMNLCVNARDAMPSNGTLTIEADNVTIDTMFAGTHGEAKPGPYVLLTVKDTGTGISPDLVDKIFEPFFTTKEDGQGTGLGLSTVLGIVKNHGGFIFVDTQVGKGAQFRVYLPAAPRDEIPQAPPQQEHVCIGQAQLLLVADDEVSVREIVKGILEASGYNVLTASDGAEALVIYVQNLGKVNLFITDMSMPFMDGLATIRSMKKLDPEIRIIAVSGAVDYAAPALSALGASERKNVAFLQKPFSAEQLLVLIQDTLKDNPCAILPKMT